MNNADYNRGLEEKIRAITNLPSLPDVAARLMRAINSPDASSAEVAALVAQDVSLSAKVLKLANSAFYGMPKSVASLNNAVVILGFRAIRTLVLCLTVFDIFSGDAFAGKRKYFDRSAFWRHSLRCGIVSRLLAQKRGGMFALDPEEAFCAGLLHDIGKIVMEQYLNSDFHKALQWAAVRGVSAFEAEREALGYTHCDVASWLIGNWSLPESIIHPLVSHHEPEKAAARAEAVMVCHIADAVSNALDGQAAGAAMDDGAAVGVGGGGGITDDVRQKAEGIGISEWDLSDVIDAMPQELEKASMFITNN